MSKEAQQLWAIAKIKGQEEEYRKAMEALNPTPIEQVKQAVAANTHGLGSFLLGLLLISIAVYFNPQFRQTALNAVEQLQTSGQINLPTNKGGR